MSKTEPEIVFTISGKEIRADRPEPVISDMEVFVYTRRIEPQIALKTLLEGHYVLVHDFYSSGLVLLQELNRYLKKKYTDQSFQSQREYRSAYRELSHRILLEIIDHKLTVRKAPEIGWLHILYPELDEFLLPFPQVQGLNSSWQWYEKGISIPVLEQKIYPFYGTYFPTRFEHLRLFDTWLKQYKGQKQSAFDIGIGSGVLSFMMLKYGFGKVYGTDSNANAIIGIHQFLMKEKRNAEIELFVGDLFGSCTANSELIVFNPPWIPATHTIDGIDKAIYYDD